MNSKIKILRITTVASTMNVILKGQLSFLNQYYEVVAATAKFDNYFDEIVRREGVKVYEVGFTRKITPIKDLIALYTLIKIISKEKPEIIHTQTPKANLIGMIASFICRTPVRILSIVGMPVYNPTSMKGKLLHNLDLVTFKLATRVYPNSRGLYKHYSNWPELKNKIDIIGNGSSNGIDFTHFNPKVILKDEVSELRKSLNIPSNSFIYVFLGRVVNDKGIKELIDAFIMLQNENLIIDSYLVVIGPMRNNDDGLPESYKEILNSHIKIRWVGLQKDVRPYLMLADAFVFPSYREGLPGSLIQAAAMGLPLIASRIVGNEEIIESVGGVLFEPRDALSLKNAMVTIFENQELRDNLKRNVREKAMNKYSQKYYWKSLHEEYEKLLAYRL